MKKLTKWIGLVAVIAMLMSMLSGLSAAADGVVVSDVVQDEVHLSPVARDEYATALGLSEQEIESLQKLLTDSGKAYAESVDISAYKIPYAQDALSVLSEFFYQDCPELFHTQFAYSYYSSTGTLAEIYFRYIYDQATYETMLAEYEAAAAKLLTGVDELESDVEKALILHDRLAVLCAYDYANLEDGLLTSSTHTSYNMYGALVKQAAVCQGYSEAYSYLLTQVGIDNYLCSSDALNHVWNIVTIDGKDYHVDVTHDDPVWDRTGRVNHTNFLLSSNALYNNGSHVATDYDTTPTDTTYDEYFWKSSDTEFQLVDGEIYYIDNSAQTLNRWNGGTSSTELQSVNDRWRASATSTWRGNYACLSSWQGKLYYSLSDEIRSYDIATGADALVITPDLSGGDYYGVYGFKAENNTLIYEPFSTPNFVRGTKETVQKVYQLRENAISITGASVTLGDTLDIHLQAEIPDSLRKDGMQLMVSSTAGTQYLPIVGGEDWLYDFTLETAAKDMTRTYTLQLVDENDAAVSDSRLMSIRSYSEKLLTGSYDDTVKNVAKAMLNYGAMAQVYFKTNTDNLANDGYETDLTAADVSAIASTEKINSPASFKGFSLLLKSKLSIRAYFSEAVDGSLSNANGHYLTVDEIGADDLATVHTLTVGDATYKFSALSLAKDVINGVQPADFKNLMRALVLYAEAVQQMA